MHKAVSCSKKIPNEEGRILNMVNRVIIQGRFCSDPEVQEKGGFSMCEFTVAWSDKYKDHETKCFLRCKAWRGMADFVGKYFAKGKECVVEGRLETEEWEKDGKKQSRTICNVERVHFCGSSKEAASSAPAEKSSDEFMKIDANANEELPFS